MDLDERREFKMSIRNGRDTPIRIAIEDQVPVSEIDEVEVELLPTTTAPTERDVRNRRGVLAWNFEAAPARPRKSESPGGCAGPPTKPQSSFRSGGSRRARGLC
jgi:hypothetical protein